MGLLEHIEELRRRLLISLIALAIGTAVGLIFGERVLRFLTTPIGGLEQLQSIEITENVGVFMRVSLLTGFVVALPVIFYELLIFVLRGLTPRETRSVLLAIPAAVLLFLGGAAFAYYILLPTALPFLTSFLGVETRPRLSNYVSFISGLIFWLGISFEMPLLVYILARFRIVTAGFLLKQWRYALIVIAVIAAMITPTVDPVNMALMMAPLIALFFLSILFAWLAAPRKA
jgi:sec-independent protein translocase protein TatC